jgi:hypothetical protein
MLLTSDRLHLTKQRLYLNKVHFSNRGANLMCFRIFFSIVCIAVMTGCGSVNVYVKPGAVLSKKSTITVTGENDQSGTRGTLEHLLLSKGFNIVSETTAKTAVRYKDQLQGSNSYNNEFSSEVYSVKELNSVYALDTRYTYYYDMLYYAYRSFSAKVVDLNTGEVVLSVSFVGDRSVNSVLEDCVEQIAKLVK